MKLPGILFLMIGIFSILFNKKIAEFTAFMNSNLFGMGSFSARPYEIVCKVIGFVNIIIGILLLSGVK
jgi:hypothetical protein